MDEEKTCHPEASHPYLENQAHSTPTLKALSGSLQGEAFELTEEKYVIGRLEGSDIVIPDKSVSRVHAMIRRKNSEYLIQDLGSVNGVYINNLRLEKAALSPGDVLQIGSCVFQFVWREP